MSDWARIVKKLQLLGGHVENVRLGEGENGRGLFVIKSNEPFELFVPKILLMPTNSLSLDTNGKLNLSNDSLDVQVRDFFLDFQESFGLNSTMLNDITLQQYQLSRISDELKKLLILYGVNKYLFSEPHSEYCFEYLKASRKIWFKKTKKFVLMPVIELFNHDELSTIGYKDNGKGISVEGKVDDEILVNYNTQIPDAIKMYTKYRFACKKDNALSGAMNIRLGQKIIRVSTLDFLNNEFEGSKLPKVKVTGNIIDISFLIISSKLNPDSPRKIFREIMLKVGMPAGMIDNVFDGIVEQNIDFLKIICHKLVEEKNEALNELTKAFNYQLTTLLDNLNT